jgi:hypothetical protein
MVSYNDKSEKGTPGLLFRQRLEYGIGTRSLAGKWDLIWSMHSHQTSANPNDIAGEKPANCTKTLSELLKENDDDLMEYSEISLIDESEVLARDKKLEYTNVLAQCLKRIDEINYRGGLLESVKGSEGVKMP